MKPSALALALLMLNGCATHDYAMYVEAQRSIAESQSRANIARYQMLGELVKTGDPTTKAIAAAGLLMGNQNGQQAPQQQQIINAPVSASEMAYRWGSLVLPFLGGVWAVKQGADVARNASNNAAAVSMNTNGTMASISKSGIEGMSANSASNASNLVNLGTTGFNSLTTLGQAGITGTSTVGQAGITGAVNLGNAGINGAVNLGAAGINGTSTVGQAGINGLNRAIDSFIPALPAP